MQQFKYNVTVDKGKSHKIILPNMKDTGFFLTKFDLNFENQSILLEEAIKMEIRLVGKDTFLILTEAALSDSLSYRLNDLARNIMTSPELYLTIKNMNSNKNIPSIPLQITFEYNYIEPYLLLNNTYENSRPDGNIVSDIISLKYATQIIFTSSFKLTLLEFVPTFISVPEKFQKKTFSVNSNNKIIINCIEEDFYPQDLINYTLNIPDNIEKINLIVYGY